MRDEGATLGPRAGALLLDRVEAAQNLEPRVRVGDVGVQDEHSDPGLDRARVDRFIGMYVNGFAVDYGERGREAGRTGIGREPSALLLGQNPGAIRPGTMTYHLRRLRLHGLIERIRATHRYRVTPTGLHAALFLTRTHRGLLRPGLSRLLIPHLSPYHPLRRCFDRLETAIDDSLRHARLAG